MRSTPLIIALLFTSLARAEEPPKPEVDYVTARCLAEYPEIAQTADGLKLCKKLSETEWRAREAEVRIDDLQKGETFILTVLDEHLARIKAVEEAAEKSKKGKK